MYGLAEKITQVKEEIDTTRDATTVRSGSTRKCGKGAYLHSTLKKKKKGYLPPIPFTRQIRFSWRAASVDTTLCTEVGLREVEGASRRVALRWAVGGRRAAVAGAVAPSTSRETTPGTRFPRRPTVCASPLSLSSFCVEKQRQSPSRFCCTRCAPVRSRSGTAERTWECARSPWRRVRETRPYLNSARRERHVSSL